MVTPFAGPAPASAPAFASAPLAPDGATERERIGPLDDRKPVNDTWAVPYRWICSIDTTYPNGDPGRGSGVLVGPRQVLTAAHCIYRREDTATPVSVSVAPARNGRTEPVGRVKAVAYSVPGRYLDPPPRVARIGSRFDFGLLTLERNVADVVYDRVRDPRPFGHWGHRHEGSFTHLRGLDAAFLPGKPVVVCGYPGDYCGRTRFDKRTCDQKRDRATVQFSHYGTASLDPVCPGMLLHTADTYPGQSGSPVWMRFRDGSRFLVGIHVDADWRQQPIVANLAVFLSPEVVALVKSWMPGVNVV